MTVHINIGSNISDRPAMISRAVAAIEKACGVKARKAPLVESEPWGYNSPNPFLNLGIALDLPPDTDIRALHRTLQSIQKSIDPSPHRTQTGDYADRAIDIDLIAAGQTVVDSPDLTLPHPRMHLRPFVLEPIAFLDPQWRHPLLNMSASSLLSKFCVVDKNK